MGLLNLIRCHGFWLNDRFNGGYIKRHYDDLVWAFNNPEQAEIKAAERLHNLLQHACKTTKFYKPYSHFKKLADFPVLQKRTIKDHFEDFVSDVYDRKSLVGRTTSGSYGMPFTFLMTREKYARQMAEILYFNECTGYKLGMKFVQIRAFKKSWFNLWLQNTIKIDTSKISPEWLARSRKILIKKKIKFIVCYPSCLLPLACYCEEKGDRPENFSLTGIVCSAEPLLENMRKKFERVFGCAVYDRYATLELGVIAHECDKCKINHINFPGYYVELLSPDSDVPVENGCPGRLVVTDLYSYAMPLIRYDIGDLACRISGKGNHFSFPSISHIQGRHYEIIYSTTGEKIDSANIALTVVYYGDDRDIIQWQFIQETKKDYLLKLVVKPTYNGELKCKKRISRLLGEDAKLRIEYVDSIPPLPSGKRPPVMNKVLCQKQ